MFHGPDARPVQPGLREEVVTWVSLTNFPTLDDIDIFVSLGNTHLLLRAGVDVDYFRVLRVNQPDDAVGRQGTPMINLISSSVGMVCNVAMLPSCPWEIECHCLVALVICPPDEVLTFMLVDMVRVHEGSPGAHPLDEATVVPLPTCVIGPQTPPCRMHPPLGCSCQAWAFLTAQAVQGQLPPPRQGGLQLRHDRRHGNGTEGPQAWQGHHGFYQASTTALLPLTQDVGTRLPAGRPAVDKVMAADALVPLASLVQWQQSSRDAENFFVSQLCLILFCLPAVEGS